MNFEHFQATRREVADVSAAVESYHTDSPTPGYVYAGDLVIEKLSDGRFRLILPNSICIEDAGNLHLHESDLYDYATHEGII